LHHQLDDVIFRYIWRVRETRTDWHAAGWTRISCPWGSRNAELFPTILENSDPGASEPTANKDSPDIRSNGFLNGIALAARAEETGSRWIKCRSGTRTA
jgi:hypothetical protein